VTVYVAIIFTLLFPCFFLSFICPVSFFHRGRRTLGGVVTRQWDRRLWNLGSIPDKGSDFSLAHFAQAEFGARRSSRPHFHLVRRSRMCDSVTSRPITSPRLGANSAHIQLCHQFLHAHRTVFIFSLCWSVNYFVSLFSSVLCVFIFLPLILVHVFLIRSLFRLSRPFSFCTLSYVCLFCLTFYYLCFFSFQSASFVSPLCKLFTSVPSLSLRICFISCLYLFVARLYFL
jgi:hypothetical protein